MKTLKVFSFINLESYDLINLSHSRWVSGFNMKYRK